MSTGQQQGSAILGVVGGIVGAYFGMPQLGFAVGWAAGGIIGGALDPPDDMVNDPGAAKLPDFNTALRGITIPVIFGTNRVTSNIVWRNNREPIRNENSSGGKGGGSGGGQRAVNVDYTYKCDLVCHLGFVTDPYTIYGGWINGSRMSFTTIENIQKQYTDTFLSGSSVVSNQDATVDMTADEMVYFPGNIPEETNWPYLVNKLGYDVRWPRTAWLGLAGLDLGNSTVIPQLSFEVGPANTGSATPDMNFVKGLAAGFTSSGGRLQGMDKYGNVWCTDSADDLRVINAGSEVVKVYTKAQLADAIYHSDELNWDSVDPITKARQAIGPVFNVLRVNVRFIPKADRLLVCIIGTRAAGEYLTVWGLMVPDQGDPSLKVSGGVVQNVGGGFNVGPFNDIYHAEAAWGNWEFDPIIVSYDTGINHTVQFESLPSIPVMEGNFKGKEIGRTVKGTGSQDILTGEVSFAEVRYMESYSGGNVSGGSTNIGRSFFHLPMIPSPGQPLDFFVCAYKGVHWADGDHNNSGSTPWYDNLPANGGMIYYYVGELAVYAPTLTSGYQFLGYTSPSMLAAADSGPVFSDRIGNRYSYFDDDASDYDTGTLRAQGTGTTSDGYHCAAYTDYNENGTVLVGFYQPIRSDATYSASPWTAKIRMRLYLWNPLTLLMTEIAKIKGPIGSTEDMGENLGLANRFYNMGMDFRRDGNNLLIAGYNNNLSAIGQSKIFLTYFGRVDIEGGADLYPPELIREILNNAYIGVFPSANIIDETSYDDAISYCRTHNIMVSTVYKNDQPAARLIESLLATYSGYLVIDYSLGKVKFGVQDQSRQPVRTLDNSHLIRRNDSTLPVKTTKGARQDTFNMIRIQYLDRSLEYKMNSIEESDEVDQDFNGIRLREFPPDLVMSEATARKMAIRALWDNLYTRDTHQFYMGWKDCDLEPGDVITLVDSFSNLNQVVRITRMKEVERGIFETNAVQQLMYIPGVAPGAISSDVWDSINYSGVYSSYTNVITYSGQPMPTRPPELRYAAAYELPPEFEADNQSRIYIGWASDGNAAGANLYVSNDGSTYSYVSKATPYQIAGQIVGEYPYDPKRPFNTDFEVILLPKSTYDVASPVFAVEATLDEVLLSGMHAGNGLLWVNSEMIAYYGVQLVSQNRYRFDKVFRGWGGTAANEINSGDWFVKHGSGIFSIVYTTDKIGTGYSFKVAPYGYTGVEYNIASIEVVSHTVRGEYYRPQNIGTIQYHREGLANPGYRNITRLKTGQDDIAISWRQSARMSGFGFGGAGTNPGGFGAFTADATSLWWKLNIWNSSGTMVRSTAVSTTAFIYTNSQNAADNGGWDGGVTFQVTPVNTYGEGRNTATLTMELFN